MIVEVKLWYDSFGAFEDAGVDLHGLRELLPTSLEEIPQPLTIYVTRDSNGGKKHSKKC